MKPQVPALTRHKARAGTRRALQYAARQPHATDAPSGPETSPSRQQARQALRPYLSH